MTRIRLGTRGSRLATVQAQSIAGLLTKHTPNLQVEFVRISTSGDRIRDVPLGPHLGQSFFTKEIEEALLAGRVDLAVHSCKDLATTMPDGLRLGAVSKREDPRDALASNGTILGELRPGAVLGTSSPRRQGFLRVTRPDLVFQDIRGNVPTRLQAVEEGRIDGVVLALAGLRRLELAGHVTEVLEPEVLLPAASQGSLGLQIREDDIATEELVRLIDHPATRAEITAERSCLRRMQAGCLAPVGVLARADGDRLSLRAAIATPDGLVRVMEDGAREDADAVGTAAGQAILGKLGLDSLRGVDWAGPAPKRLTSNRGGTG